MSTGTHLDHSHQITSKWRISAKVLQDIIDTCKVQLGSSKEDALVIPGGKFYLALHMHSLNTEPI